MIPVRFSRNEPLVMHFTLGWRHCLGEDGRGEPIRATFRCCWPAMVQITVICGVGMLVLGASDLLPTARFGCLMSAMLFTALLGDLILLPALLALVAVRRSRGPRGEGRRNGALS
jgi:predicted RND superfamily exporter protein